MKMKIFDYIHRFSCKRNIARVIFWWLRGRIMVILREMENKSWWKSYSKDSGSKLVCDVPSTNYPIHLCGSRGPRRAQGGPKEGPRRAQGGPKEGPKRAQGGPKEGPRRAQGGPKEGVNMGLDRGITEETSKFIKRGKKGVKKEKNETKKK